MIFTYLEAHVVFIPLVQKLSLTATKTPSKFDNFLPLLILFDDFSAFLHASSSVNVINAFKFLFNSFIRVTEFFTYSIGHNDFSSNFLEI